MIKENGTREKVSSMTEYFFLSYKIKKIKKVTKSSVFVGEKIRKNFGDDS